MKKPDPFESPKRQLRRGKRDVERLKKRFDTFLKNVRHTKVSEIDPKTGETVIKMRFNRRIPKSFSDTAYTVIDALRSALDQTGYAAAIASGKTDPKYTQFPIGNDLAGLKTGIKGRCKHLPPEIVTLFRSFDPYKGGNDTLWALNKLRHSFHTAIIPNTLTTGGMHLRDVRITQGPVSIPTPVWDSAKNEIAFLRLGPGAVAHYNLAVALTISFDKIEFLQQRPIFGVLREMAAEVERVLTATEAECRRLGWLK
jgi:hypothetical protein